MVQIAEFIGKVAKCGHSSLRRLSCDFSVLAWIREVQSIGEMQKGFNVDETEGSLGRHAQSPACGTLKRNEKHVYLRLNMCTVYNTARNYSFCKSKTQLEQAGLCR